MTNIWLLKTTPEGPFLGAKAALAVARQKFWTGVMVEVGVLVGIQVGAGVTVPPKGEYQTSPKLPLISWPVITHI